MLRIFLFSFLFIFFLSLYNIAIIKWGTESVNRSFQNRLWHLYGWIVRFIPAIFIFWHFWGEWARIGGFFLVYLHLGWTMYDGVINKGRGLSFFYQGTKQSGTGSWIDRNIGRTSILITKLLIFLATITYLIFIPIF